MLPVDLGANAASLGVTVLRANGVEEFRKALAQAKSVEGPVMVHVETDPLVHAPDSESWWDVPVSEVAGLDTTKRRPQDLRGAQGVPEALPDPCSLSRPLPTRGSSRS